MTSETDVSDPSTTGRRDEQRLRLQIPAKFSSMDGNEPVLLLDLSQSGARIACSDAPRFKRGVLEWMAFEAYSEVVWRRAETCAIRFDPPLAFATVFTTRELAPDEWQRHKESMLEAARTWRAARI